MKNAKQIPKRIWLVGGSEGIGLSLVHKLLQANCQIVVSARNAEQNAELLALQTLNPKKLFLLSCDVTNKAILKEISDQAWSVYDGLDCWIYNVGAYHPMRLEEWDIDSFETMNQVNYLAVVYLMTYLLPLFKAEMVTNPMADAQWLWNISLASDFGLPYGGGYSAPKAALQNLAESLQPELSEAGIHLKVVNHGFVKTRLTAKNNFPMLGLMTPEIAAEKIVQALSQKKFETRFPLNLAFVLGSLKLLPKPWALAITKRMLKDE